MGFSVGLSNWPVHDAALMAALEAFGRARGRRFDAAQDREAPLGPAFFAVAATRRELTAPPYGIQRGYSRAGERLAWAIEDFLKGRLHLQEWLDRGGRMHMGLALVPFAFSDGARGEPPWAEVGGADTGLLIGSGAGFVTYWDGGYEDDAGRAYRARAEAARAALDGGQLDDAVDSAAAPTALAVEVLFYDLIAAAWDRNLLVSVMF